MQPLIVANAVRRSVADFLSTAFPSTTPGSQGLIDRFLGQPGNLFRGPYLSVVLPFRAGATGKSFSWLPASFTPHAHRSRAWNRLAGEEARSTLVATGTGSGKTECFLYPIIEHCREQRALGHRGIKAIILYPMKALATDQAKRMAKEILSRPGLSDIRAGLYVGDAPEETSDCVKQLPDESFTLITDRAEMRKQPPDILLTNYKMLDFMLIRADDAGLWAHSRPDTLSYLVVNELHTFDGAQGTDLSCLIRRVKATAASPDQRAGLRPKHLSFPPAPERLHRPVAALRLGGHVERGGGKAGVPEVVLHHLDRGAACHPSSAHRLIDAFPQFFASFEVRRVFAGN